MVNIREASGLKKNGNKKAMIIPGETALHLDEL